MVVVVVIFLDFSYSKHKTTTKNCFIFQCFFFVTIHFLYGFCFFLNLPCVFVACGYSRLISLTRSAIIFSFFHCIVPFFFVLLVLFFINFSLFDFKNIFIFHSIKLFSQNKICFHASHFKLV